jgi:hypothetical protein
MPGSARAVAGIGPVGWTALGPDHLGGHIRSIAIHPTQPNKMWAAAMGGGLWTTTDGGANWSAINNLPTLAVTSIVLSPANPNVMFATTGDSMAGSGILRSTDAGVTWVALPSTIPANTSSPWRFIGKLAIHPGDANVMLASNAGGVYRSVDGGANWVQAPDAYGQPVFDPMDGARVVASGSYSTNAGASWTQSTGATYSTAVAHAFARQGGVVYRSSGFAPWQSLAETSTGGVERSTNGGAQWTQLATLNHLGPHPWAHNAIWVDPTDANHLIVGGRDLFRSTNGGTTWTQISNGTQAGSVPSGQHAIVSHPGYNGTSNRTIYVGGAGGIYMAADIQAVTAPSVGWTALNNGLAAMTFHSGAGHSGTNGRIIGGTDNGSLVYSGSGKSWTRFAAGYAGGTAIDPNDGHYIYGTGLLARLYRSTTGGAPVSPIDSGLAAGGGGPLLAPFILDPNNPNVMLVGSYNLQRSTNVKAASPQWSSAIFEIDFTYSPEDGFISHIAVAPGNSNLIWLSSVSGSVYKTTNGTAAKPAWLQVGGFIPHADRYTWTERAVSTLLINKDDHQMVYAGGSQGLWRTLNGGQTWTLLTNSIRDIRTIQQHPLHPGYIYLGTDQGIFASENSGATWSPTSEGPVNTRVTQLFWRNNSTLVAATLGRGMFSYGVTVPAHALAIAKGGSGAGTVTSNPAGINCGATCSASFTPGTSVTLTATPAGGSTFAGWSGACTGFATCTVSMTAARSVTAHFTSASSYPLVVTKGEWNGAAGQVTSAPAGVNCGPTCSANFAAGTQVTLTATPASGSFLRGWTGDCGGVGATCTVSMMEAKAVNMIFEKGYRLSVSIGGTGGGSVSSSPAGIQCGATCQADFAPQSSVTLTPVANSGSVFVGWSGACSGAGACVVNMLGDRSVVAIFNNTSFRTLTIFKSGTGSGPVVSSNGGIACGGACSASFAPGTNVTLTATPNSGAIFGGWSGGCSGTATTCLVTMDADKSVTATYHAVRTLTVSKAGSGSGPVTSSPAGIACGSTCSASYVLNTSVTLTAAPNSGSVFAGWSGACSGTASTCVVPMNDAKNVTATFNRASAGFTLSVAKAGVGSGPVTSSPGGISCGSTCSASYVGGTTVTLTATPNSGSVFAGWAGICSGTSTCVVSMTAGMTATAVFNRVGPTLTISKAGTGTGPVTSNPPGLFCGSMCSASFAQGTSVTLIATPNSGSVFTGWSGACTGSSDTCVVSMDAAKNVTATFITFFGTAR